MLGLSSKIFKKQIHKMTNNLNSLEKTLNYSFKNQSYLTKALTHSSKSKDNNERLEYLGDAVINLAVSEHLIKNFSDLQNLLQQIRQVITSHEPISLMKAYFSIADNIPDWNNVLPPLKKIADPANQKLVLILKELVKKIDPLIANT